MKSTTRAEAVKAFAMTNMLLEADLDGIEREHNVSLKRSVGRETATESPYYSQFDERLRNEAREMSIHYELLYCLEQTIRDLIKDVFEASGDPDWWANGVPDAVKQNARRSIKREREAAVTPRSSEEIDYTTFGELGEIIKANWSLFGSVFNDIKAVEKVLSNLNSLRNPIAHCAPLAPDEVLRLELSLRDWFRIQE